MLDFEKLQFLNQKTSTKGNLKKKFFSKQMSTKVSCAVFCADFKSFCFFVLAFLVFEEEAKMSQETWLNSSQNLCKHMVTF